MNKNIRKLVGNGLIIGGFATAAGSVFNMTQNKAFNDVHDQRLRITRELQDFYNVDAGCVSLPAGNGIGAICGEQVIGDPPDEQQILTEYREELDQKLSEVPYDPISSERKRRNALGLLEGLLGIGVGGFFRSSKERG